MAAKPIEIGDEITLTVKGRVTNSDLSGTPDAMAVRVFRPDRPGVPRVLIDVVVEPQSVVSFNIDSKYKPGLHRDASGNLWMRQEDGWHRIIIDDNPLSGQNDRPFTPPTPERIEALPA